MTRVKMCGMRTPADIAAANLVEPDYVGFVFVPGRRRAVSPERARVLRGLLGRGIKAVGVFVDAPVDAVAALLADGTIDAAQLHGAEDAAYIGRLRRAACLAPADAAYARIIDARTVRTPADVRAACASPADAILLDNGMGSGEAFDHSLAELASRPFFLAGGLAPETVGAAIARLAPFAVDVSSGIEVEGAKDLGRMRAFSRAVAAADAAGPGPGRWRAASRPPR
jgi:phosphoribosylanthranilate isomerase